MYMHKNIVAWQCIIYIYIYIYIYSYTQILLGYMNYSSTYIIIDCVHNWPYKDVNSLTAITEN